MGERRSLPTPDQEQIMQAWGILLIAIQRDVDPAALTALFHDNRSLGYQADLADQAVEWFQRFGEACRCRVVEEDLPDVP